MRFVVAGSFVFGAGLGIALAAGIGVGPAAVVGLFLLVAYLALEVVLAA